LAAVVAVVLVALLVPWPDRPHEAMPPAGLDGQPTLPDEFAAYSRLTSSISQRPAGRAIAFYEYGSWELFTTWQALVVGADRDTYRRLDTDTNAAPVLLSPDGTKLMRYTPRPGTDEFALVDLATARTAVRHSVEWMSNVGVGLTMLAWSPDGRYIAYSVPAPPPADGTAASSFVDDVAITHLAILDVANDTTVRYPAISPVLGAAFAPDSQRLAVQMSGESWIVSVHGEKLAKWWLPANTDLASSAAWSPDGNLIATIIRPPTRPDGVTTWDDTVIRFMDATGANRPVPADLPYARVLGWRSPTSVVLHQWLDDVDADAIIAVSTVDGTRTVLSRFSRSNSCEYGLQRCQAYRIQLATELLSTVGIRPSDPDRGPVAAVWSALWIPVLALILGLAAGWMINTYRRRARRARLA
jgi:dipeptidyl aminopeptidase/acylaminoacyl peptidase